MGPFAEGKFGIFENPALAAIARKHGKSIAQVIARWLIKRRIANFMISDSRKLAAV